MLKRTLSIIALVLTTACSAPLTAHYDVDSKEFALAKAAIEGLTNYAKTSNKEQLKRFKVKTRNFQKPSIIETMLREAGDLTCDYVVNMALDAMGGKTLCDGKGPKSYPINLHKALSILIVETAKLIATEKLTPQKLSINVFKKLVEKTTIATGNTPAEVKRNQRIILGLGLAAATLNSEFYEDLEAGTVDINELKNGLGKYRSLEGTVNAFCMGELGERIGKQTAANFGSNTKYTQKYIGDLMMIPLKHLLFAITGMVSVAIEHPEQFKKAIQVSAK